jgi:predicted dithiol-disulfide oxidoreductase (DUF899 family)
MFRVTPKIRGRVLRGSLAEVPLHERPCPACTALIDVWKGAMPHFEGLAGNLAIVARAPIEPVTAFAHVKVVH